MTAGGSEEQADDDFLKTGKNVSPDGRYSIEIRGSTSGQVAAGRDIRGPIRYRHTSERSPTTEADRAAVHELVSELNRLIVAEVSSERRAAALERVDELYDAIVADEPDITTMQYVRNWFARHLPKLAGSITGLIVHPLVGRIIENAGEPAVADFRHRFGGSDS